MSDRVNEIPPWRNRTAVAKVSGAAPSPCRSSSRGDSMSGIAPVNGSTSKASSPAKVSSPTTAPTFAKASSCVTSVTAACASSLPSTTPVIPPWRQDQAGPALAAGSSGTILVGASPQMVPELEVGAQWKAAAPCPLPPRWSSWFRF